MFRVALVAATGVACSSGGDESSDGDDGEVVVLPQYEFEMTSHPETPVVVQVPMGEGVNLRLRHLGEVPVLFGDFDIEATQTWVVPVEEFATSGAMAVRRGSERVLVTVLPAGAGVNVEWDEDNNGTLDGSVALSWDEFEDLPDGAPEWQELASFAYSAAGHSRRGLPDFHLVRRCGERQREPGRQLQPGLRILLDRHEHLR